MKHFCYLALSNKSFKKLAYLGITLILLFDTKKIFLSFKGEEETLSTTSATSRVLASLPSQPIQATISKAGDLTMDEVCAQEPVFGDCNVGDNNISSEKFYWDMNEQNCFAFTYKLCPSGNIFETEEECLSRCKKTSCK